MLDNRYNNTAIVDADYIIWIACNGNKVYEKGEATREHGKLVYTDKTLDQAINTCDSYINDILTLTHVDSYIMCLTGKKNFRLNIDSSYKANRAGKEKPLWFKEVRNHLIEHWNALEVEGLEADDLVNIISNNLNKSFIIAVDKDILECIPGRHFDARKGKIGFVTTIPDYAERNFAISMMVGDKIDGIPNIKPGYGPKTAEKDLDALIKEGETPLKAAHILYLQILGESGEERFQSQFKLLKILDSFESLPEGITFEIPEPDCYNCIETVFSDIEYRIDIATENQEE